MTAKERIQSATDIGVPKGESARACREAIQEEGDFELPSFDGRLFARTQGKTVWMLRGVDIVRRVAEGRLDVGVVGTDVLMNTRVEPSGLVGQRIGDGDPMCRFSLLAEEGMAAQIEGRLDADARRAAGPMEFPTAYPRMLTQIAAWRDLPVVPSGMEITGSAEAYASLTGLGRVADLVSTGETARRNGLLEVFTLCEIYPELVWRPDENL